MNTVFFKKNIKDEPTETEKGDIQGLLARGYKPLNAAVYLFLHIKDAPKARAYLSWLVKHHVTTADQRFDGDNNESLNNKHFAVNIAFTSCGLKAIELSPKIISTFSREFTEGICYEYKKNGKTIRERSTLLGDVSASDPDLWHWGNSKEKPIHCVLMLFALCNNCLADLRKNIWDSKELRSGLDLSYDGDTYLYKSGIEKEHFGFNDGIGQPIIKGFSKAKESDTTVNTGEFILGYHNAYNNHSPSPFVITESPNIDLPNFPVSPKDSNLQNKKIKKDLGKNGTYLVIRQMEQHVEKFWKYMYDKSREKGNTQMEKAVSLAAKMTGRWPNGESLTVSLDGSADIPADELDSFLYTDQDSHGLRCPFGAHIRRTNPRDQVHTGRNKEESLEMSGRHRMLRRGRIYGEPLDEDFNIERMICKSMRAEIKELSDRQQTQKVRGLYFICLVSDIQRQFEFVQNVWVNTVGFADLCKQVDPIIGPRSENAMSECHEFTTQQHHVRKRYKDVPEFTTVIGGAYFFMPGIKALKYIINHSGCSK